MPNTVPTQLRLIQEHHCEQAGNTDPLCAFLRIHVCVCTCAEAVTYTHALHDLNKHFIERFTHAYCSHAINTVPLLPQGRPLPLHAAWHAAFTAYAKGDYDNAPKSQYCITLGWFLTIHLFEDLPEVLADAMRAPDPITGEEFSAIGEHIHRCIQEVAPEIADHLPELVQFLCRNDFLPRRLAGGGIWVLRKWIWHSARTLANKTSTPPTPSAH